MTEKPNMYQNEILATHLLAACLSSFIWIIAWGRSLTPSSTLEIPKKIPARADYTPTWDNRIKVTPNYYAFNPYVGRPFPLSLRRTDWAIEVQTRLLIYIAAFVGCASEFRIPVANVALNSDLVLFVANIGMAFK